MPLKRQTTANGKCKAKTKAGRSCAAPAVRGRPLCAFHSDPRLEPNAERGISGMSRSTGWRTVGAEVFDENRVASRHRLSNEWSPLHCRCRTRLHAASASLPSRPNFLR